MSYFKPAYIANANIEVPEILYKWDDRVYDHLCGWDDRKIDELFIYDPGEIVKKIILLSKRAQLAIAISVFEWIAWRLYVFNKMDCYIPFKIAEAAWCGMVDERYAEYTEFRKEKWMGPVEGPLWCGISWLMPMIHFEEKGVEEFFDGIFNLPRLAMHILPCPEIFENWLYKITDKLLINYKATKAEYIYKSEELFDDLFSEVDHGGRVVPREALDPDFDFKIRDTKKYISKFLSTIDITDNPSLYSPEEMIENGFEGTPYKFK